MDDILPNSLTNIPKIDWAHSHGVTWFYLFCASCGADGGRVMDTLLPAQYAFYLCNSCAEKYGDPAGFSKTPDDVFRQKVTDAMIERYGHVLNESELMQELDKKHSVISKLEREGRQRN
jgi:hypothetical protein